MTEIAIIKISWIWIRIPHVNRIRSADILIILKYAVRKFDLPCKELWKFSYSQVLGNICHILKQRTHPSPKSPSQRTFSTCFYLSVQHLGCNWLQKSGVFAMHLTSQYHLNRQCRVHNRPLQKDNFFMLFIMRSKRFLIVKKWIWTHSYINLVLENSSIYYHCWIVPRLRSAMRNKFSVSLMISSRQVKLEQLPNRNFAISIFLCRFSQVVETELLPIGHQLFNDLIIQNRKSNAPCSKIIHFQITGYLILLYFCCQVYFMVVVPWPNLLTTRLTPIFIAVPDIDVNQFELRKLMKNAYLLMTHLFTFLVVKYLRLVN